MIVISEKSTLEWGILAWQRIIVLLLDFMCTFMISISNTQISIKSCEMNSRTGWKVELKDFPFPD